MNEEAQIAEESQPQLSTPERFNELYNSGKLHELAHEEVPPLAMERFENWSKKYISPEQYIPKNFTGLHVLEHENGDKVYIAELIRQYGENPETGELMTFVETYLMEMRGDVEIGHSEMRRDVSENPVHASQPYVGYSETEKEHRHERLGERRMNTMNAFAQTQYGTPLFSGTTISPSAHGMMQKLVKEGKAEQVTDDSTNPPTISYRMPKIVPKEK